MAVLADSTGYGNAGLEDFTKALAAHKLKPAHVGRFDIGVKDMTDAVKAARDSNAQVLFTITVGPENAVIARAREALPSAGRWPRSARGASPSRPTSTPPRALLKAR